LKEAARYNINTGFGKDHEEDALDLYEKQCGWEVTCRNEDLKCWKFELDSNGNAIPMNWAESVVKSSMTTTAGGEKVMDISKTSSSSSNSTTRCNKKGDLSDMDVIIIKDEEEGKEDHDDNTYNHNHKDQNGPPIQSSKGKEDMVSLNHDTSHNTTRTQSKNTKPFFSIMGVADGIREELYHVGCRNNDERIHHNSLHKELDIDNDADWALRKVVVECKHRMNKAFLPPPMYDQIQLVIYCMMYGTSEGDMVQVVRNRAEPKPRPNVKETTSDKEQQKEESISSPSLTTLTTTTTSSTTSTSVAVAAMSSTSLSTTPSPSTSSTLSNSHKTNITISRVSLENDTMKHRQNWHDTILPRLTSFVHAVYNVRASDDKRYRMIHAAAMASSGGDESDWWNIVLEECPWLKQCEIAFYRKNKTI
jgi:hypothetical protein